MIEILSIITLTILIMALLYDQTRTKILIIKGQKAEFKKAKIQEGNLLTKNQTWVITTKPILIQKTFTSYPLYLVKEETNHTLSWEDYKYVPIPASVFKKTVDAGIIKALFSSSETKDKYVKYLLYSVLAIVAVVAMFLIFGGQAHVETTCKTMQPLITNTTKVI